MASPHNSASSANLAGDLYRSNGSVSKLAPANKKSCESIYSTSSSKPSTSGIHRPKIPTNLINRQPAIIPAPIEVQKRVISARRLRYKSVQNQLGLAQHKITELSNENRMLHNSLKRLENRLAKYESNTAELPRLLHAHTEELRAWKTKFYTLQVAHKEQEQKLKQKEAVILTLGDENKYYSHLIKDRNLEDRHRLAERIHSLEAELREKENQLKIAERRSQLELKNMKQQMQNEQKKTREVLQKLVKARQDLSNYQKLDEVNAAEKLSSTSIKQSDSKNSKKPKAKPYGRSKVNGSQTLSPSATPMLDALGVENDDSDHLISNRSLKSASSSLNLDYSTTRTTVRKKPSSIEKRHSKDTTCISKKKDSESIDVKTDQTKKSEESRKKKILRKPMKMMVNIPRVDNGAGGDASQKEDDADTDYNFNDDYDKIADGEEVSNHELHTKFYHEDSISSEIDHNGDDDDEDDESKKILCTQKTHDYKGRETFLDNLSRQKSRTSIRSNETKSSKVSENVEEATCRKNRLLAALKAIDDDQFST